MIKQLSVHTLKEWLSKDDIILIDVREPAEHSSMNIKKSKLIPLSQICLSMLPAEDNKKLVLQCKSGMRSSSACNKLLKEDPELTLYNLDGGILAWEEAGYPVKYSGKKILALDRQVQLSVGILLLSSAALTHFISPVFSFIPVFIGLGLSIAGLTGRCGLGLLIAKMPWNQR